MLEVTKTPSTVLQILTLLADALIEIQEQVLGDDDEEVFIFFIVFSGPYDT